MLIYIILLIISWISLVWINYNSNDLIKEEIVLNEELVIKNLPELDNIKEIILYAWWDVMISRYVGYLANKNWRKSITDDYNPIDWKENWITFFNLESPFSKINKDTIERVLTFWANIDGIEAIKNIIWNNIWIISLANNHALDSWIDNLKMTEKLLLDNSIYTSWIQNNIFTKINKNDLELCFEAYTYNYDNKIVKKIDLDQIKNDINEMEKYWCDFNIISLHWWREYYFEPTEEQRILWKNIIDSWADLIIWHHSHIPWEIEIYNEKPIIYSLGNYIFDQNWWKNWCMNSWTCEYDEKIWKNTINTYIWTLLEISFKKINWNKKIEIIDKNYHRIDNWVLKPF